MAEHPTQAVQNVLAAIGDNSQRVTSFNKPKPPGGLAGAWAQFVVPTWEKGRSSVIMAMRSLWLHKMRSFLSVLGIIIGIAAAITLVAFGNGSMQDALDDIKRQGATNIIVSSIKPPDDSTTATRSFFLDYGLKQRDLNALRQLNTVRSYVPMRNFAHDIRRLDRMCRGRIVATTEAYRNVNRFKMVAGRFIEDARDGNDYGDDREVRNVVVLGWNVANELFPFESPFHPDGRGKTVVLNKQNYTIIGVIGERMSVGSSTGNATVQDFNNDVYIPMRTCELRFGPKIYIRQSGSRSGEIVKYHQIVLTVREMSEVRPTSKVVKRILERNHKQKKDWTVAIPLDRLDAAERTRERYGLLLLLISSISLLVGGIGIMNIMLATVTERTREIGIRRALGAKRRDIIAQFVIEAVVQTTIGGILGVAFGLAIVLGVPVIWEAITETPLPAQLSLYSIFLSLGVAAGVGIVFGLYPAQRAAKLEPI
ncbi:MAG: ABC transporter permease [Gemmataceae bacterium]